eukprot:jgi/Mesvir1/2892/Mv13965-RA.1
MNVANVRIHNVGGSILSVLQLSLIAWGIRRLRVFFASRESVVEDSNSERKPTYAFLSPRALELLVELDPFPHTFIDVRSKETLAKTSIPPTSDVELAKRSAPALLYPIPFTSANPCVHIDEADISEALKRPPSKSYTGRFRFRQPLYTDFLVFISTYGERAEKAAKAASALGYHRCAVLKGGLVAYSQMLSGRMSPPVPSPSAAGPSSQLAEEKQEFRALNRDALAVLLDVAGVSEKTFGVVRPTPAGAKAPEKAWVTLVDLRRSDERSLYGFIPGSVHIPADRFPLALAMSPEEFLEDFGVPKFGKSDVVVLHSLTHMQAAPTGALAGRHRWRQTTASNVFTSTTKEPTAGCLTRRFCAIPRTRRGKNLQNQNFLRFKRSTKRLAKKSFGSWSCCIDCGCTATACSTIQRPSNHKFSG